MPAPEPETGLRAVLTKCTSVTAVLGPHRVGLMRPYLAGEPGTEPFVVCREARAMPQVPVICTSREDARAFALAASEMGRLSRSGWLGFRGERLRPPMRGCSPGAMTVACSLGAS